MSNKTIYLWQWVFGFIIAIVFIAYNWSVIGPQYLSDEIGYLSRVAAIAMYPIDLVTPWHGGYSFIIAPLFRVFSDPLDIWKGIIVLNAVTWAVSFSLWVSILRMLFPDKNPAYIFAVVVITAIYPAWISMSGYAFPTTTFALCYTLAVYFLSKYFFKNSNERYLYLSSFLIGYLFWLHPAGFMVVLSYLLLLCISRKLFTHRIILQIVVIMVMVLTYRYLITPWLISITNISSNAIAGDYPSPTIMMDRGFTRLFTYEGLLYFIGPYMSLMIRSLGVINYFYVNLFRKSKEKGYRLHDLEPRESIFLLIGISLAGICILTTCFFLYARHGFYANFMFYARYTEMAFLPVLVIGFMYYDRNLKWLPFILLTILGYFYLSPHVDITLRFNKVNLISYWPLHILPNNATLFGLIVTGIAGAMVVGFAQKIFDRKAIVILIILNLVCITSAKSHHLIGLRNYSRPCGLYDYIRQQYSSDTMPILFDKASVNRQERDRQAVFYLYDHNLRVGTLSDWNNLDKGLFITRYPERLNKSKDVIRAHDPRWGLYLAERTTNIKRDSHSNTYSASPDYSPIYVASPGENSYLDIATSSDFSQPFASSLLTHAGYKSGNSIYSNGKSGALIFGPYKALTAGEYRLIMMGEVDVLSQAVIDVVSNKAKTIHAREKLKVPEEKFGGITNVISDMIVSISHDVSDIQVRVLVGEKDKIRIDGYIMQKVNISNER